MPLPTTALRMKTVVLARSRAVALVLSDARPVWVMLGGLIAASTLGSLTSASWSDAARYAGTILQVLGLGTVALGIGHMRKLFDRVPVRTRVWVWFGNLWKAITFRPTTVNIDGIVGFAMPMLLGQLSVDIKNGPALTVEERIEILEANLALLSKDLDDRFAALKQDLALIDSSVRSESSVRQTADRATEEKIEAVAIGGIQLEIVGLGWLVAGVVAASVPGELAALIAQLF